MTYDMVNPYVKSVVENNSDWPSLTQIYFYYNDYFSLP